MTERAFLQDFCRPGHHEFDEPFSLERDGSFWDCATDYYNFGMVRTESPVFAPKSPQQVEKLFSIVQHYTPSYEVGFDELAAWARARDGELVTCVDCGGSGKRYEVPSRLDVSIPCSDCDGAGRVAPRPDWHSIAGVTVDRSRLCDWLLVVRASRVRIALAPPVPRDQRYWWAPLALLCADDAWRFYLAPAHASAVPNGSLPGELLKTLEAA